ncbi:gamma-glutamyl-gamma-aminobutyrate hydrolase family protein [Stenotrophomonas lacuserhaii]|uniref:gamma-glutamyl-gamma-aminobutyrate hydrolase family protein n=1 Tax=Stenotrophomonas lacuserhaii TaxID=2760084 RepID=UPI0015F96421|nr:gamma-glutamyl-gamma-aminobutyrate hydrolase family protein [Stenotrophomonas lacuserhaii]
MRLPPLVGLPTDSTLQGHHRFAMAGGMYVRALADAAVVTPVLLPSLQPPLPAAGGLAQWHGGRSAVVNPVHGQGIEALADGLLAEAHADGGLVEAARSRRHSFVPGVPWHPQWRVTHSPFYHAVLHAFGQACRQRQRFQQDSA